MRSRHMMKFAGLALAAGIAVVLLGRAAFGGATDRDLIRQAGELFGRLPKTMTSEKNPITPEKARLGKMLFYETRVSADGTTSCARCHPISRYAADGLQKPVGDSCKAGPRNAPTVLNAAAQISEHWVGNRTDVEDQARQALTSPAFGMPSNNAVENALAGIKGYATLFKSAFPGDVRPVSIGNFALAVGAFERTLVTPSPFDAFIRGDSTALTSDGKRGLSAFVEAQCAGCHSGTYVGGQMYDKFGIVAPYWRYTKSKAIDLGRFEITHDEADRYVFKVPILRNVAMTAPYFHDGSVSRLDTAIWIMGKVQHGEELSKAQIERIHAFLRSLTGVIPEEIETVPILPATE